MATAEQIEKIYKIIEISTPADFFKRANDIGVGIGAVLRFLHESNGTVTAGKISEILGVSTARVAVLLKKMVAKGLIEKAQDTTDGRITVVKLTEAGIETVKRMQREMREYIGSIIDTVGEERFLEFIEISNEIRAIAKEPNQGVKE